MTRPATKTEALITVLSFLIFAGAAASPALSNLYRTTEENGGEIDATNGLAPGRVRSSMYVVDEAAPGAADTNPGTEQMPFKTVQHAADAAKPGDTIYVMAGKYDERVKVKAGGTEGRLVAFVAMPRRSATVARGAWSRARRTSAVCGTGPSGATSTPPNCRPTKERGG